MLVEPWGPPPATMCDPHRHRDLVPGWSCKVPGCDCGSTPSLFDARVPEPALLARYDGDLDRAQAQAEGEVADGFAQDLREELRHIYEVAALDREAEALAREAKDLRDPWWLRSLRWLVGDATRAL